MKYFLYKCVIHVTNNLILNLVMLHYYCYVLLTNFFSIETRDAISETYIPGNFSIFKC